MDKEIQEELMPDYRQMTEIIREELNKASQAFLLVGYCLKQIRDRRLYVEGGYPNIYEFGMDQFGLSKSSVSRFIGICERFSDNGSSAVLSDRFHEFSISQLVEMLPLSQEELEGVTPDMTNQTIRQYKKSIREEGQGSSAGGSDALPAEGAVIPFDIPASGMQPEMPDLKNMAERKAWLRNVEAWGMWYADKNIGVKYFRYDFEDGSTLIATRDISWEPSRLEEMIKKAGAQDEWREYYEKQEQPEYHMRFSDSYYKQYCGEFHVSYEKYYNTTCIDISTLANFIMRIQGKNRKKQVTGTADKRMGIGERQGGWYGTENL